MAEVDEPDRQVEHRLRRRPDGTPTAHQRLPAFLNDGQGFLAALEPLIDKRSDVRIGAMGALSAPRGELPAGTPFLQLIVGHDTDLHTFEQLLSGLAIALDPEWERDDRGEQRRRFVPRPAE